MQVRILTPNEVVAVCIFREQQELFICNMNNETVKKCGTHRIKGLLSKTGERILTVTSAGMLIAQDIFNGQIMDLMYVGELPEFDEGPRLVAVSADLATRLVAVQFCSTNELTYFKDYDEFKVETVEINVWDTKTRLCIKQITNYFPIPFEESMVSSVTYSFTEDLEYLVTNGNCNDSSLHTDIRIYKLTADDINQ